MEFAYYAQDDLLKENDVLFLYEAAQIAAGTDLKYPYLLPWYKEAENGRSKFVARIKKADRDALEFLVRCGFYCAMHPCFHFDEIVDEDGCIHENPMSLSEGSRIMRLLSYLKDDSAEKRLLSLRDEILETVPDEDKVRGMHYLKQTADAERGALFVQLEKELSEYYEEHLRPKMFEFGYLRNDDEEPQNEKLTA